LCLNSRDGPKPCRCESAGLCFDGHHTHALLDLCLHLFNNRPVRRRAAVTLFLRGSSAHLAQMPRMNGPADLAVLPWNELSHLSQLSQIDCDTQIKHWCGCRRCRTCRSVFCHVLKAECKSRCNPTLQDLTIEPCRRALWRKHRPQLEPGGA
jgi:hypothetical protein